MILLAALLVAVVMVVLVAVTNVADRIVSHRRRQARGVQLAASDYGFRGEVLGRTEARALEAGFRKSLRPSGP
jgi:hypothetical protein